MDEIKLKVVNWGPNEIWRIKKNIGVITVALMIHYTASNGALNLQSSINAEAGLGTAALLSMFIGVLFASMFLTSMVIKFLGIKWTVCFSFIAYMPFISFQMYPRFATLVPAALLMGVGSGIKICAKSTYIAVLAEAHSMISKIPASKTLLSFSGCYFMIVQMSQFWGNLISSLVLSAANNASVTSVNETLIPHICGSNFLPNLHAVKALPAQPPEKIMTLAGIYLTCIMVAMLLIVTTLDTIKRYEICRKGSGNGLSGFGLLAATIKQLTADTNQQLLLAITIFIGLEQGFFAADFTASFVSCAIGTGSVGYVMMTFGICNAVGCFATTYLAKLSNRLPLMCAAAFIHCGLLVTLLAWRPHAGGFNVMLIIAGLWGICDSTWAVQITTYYGVLFRGKEEAAYSNLGLWEGVGYIISFAMSSYVRTRYKVYLLLCFLVAGTIGYLIVEYRTHKSKSKAERQDMSRNNSTISEKDRLAELEKFTT